VDIGAANGVEKLKFCGIYKLLSLVRGKIL